MEKRALHYQNLSFGPDKAERCRLKVMVAPDGVSWMVKEEHGPVQVFDSWQFPPARTAQALRKILQQDALLTYPFSGQEVLFMMPATVCVPTRMFDAEASAAYLNALTGQTFASVQHDYTKDGEQAVVSGFSPEIEDIIRYFFPKCTTRLQPAGLLDFWLQASPSDAAAVFVHIRPSYIQVCGYERGNLLFFNTFKYEKPSDVLYFTLLVYDQLHLKPANDPLYISGDLLQEADIYRQYERFIRNIHFLQVKPLPGLPDNMASHLYLDHQL